MNNASTDLCNKKYNHFIGLDIGIVSSYIALFSNAPTIKNEFQSEQTEAGGLCSQSKLLYMKSDSAVSYDDDLKYKYKFSQKIFSKGERPKQKRSLYRNFPFLLYEQFDPKSHDGKLKNIKNTEKFTEVMAKYLCGFIQEFLTEVNNKHYDHRICKSEIRYVITVPQLCLLRTKSILIRSIIKAGLVSTSDIPQRVSFIPKTKATACYCYQNVSKCFKLNVPQRFVLLDSSGSTMSAIIFDTEFPPSKNGPLLKDIQAHAQTDCGLLNIAEEFKDLLSQKFKANSFKPPSQVDLDNMTDEFIKDKMRGLSFRLGEFDPEEVVSFRVPWSCSFPSSFADRSGFIEKDTLKITHKDLYENIFEGNICKTINLISHLLKKLPVNEQNIDAILLVGDLSQLPWLYNEIRDNFEGKSIGANSVLEVPNGEFAACSGAILYELGL